MGYSAVWVLSSSAGGQLAGVGQERSHRAIELIVDDQPPGPADLLIKSM
jgi:hypothetical protein